MELHRYNKIKTELVMFLCLSIDKDLLLNNSSTVGFAYLFSQSGPHLNRNYLMNPSHPLQIT